METFGNLNLEKLKDQNLEIVGMIEVDNRLGFRHLFENKPVVVVQSKHIDIKIPEKFGIEWLADNCFEKDQLVKVRMIDEKKDALENIKFADLVDIFNGKWKEKPVFTFDFDLDEMKSGDEFSVPMVIRLIASNDKLVRFTKKIKIDSRNVFTDFKISSSHLMEWYHVVKGLVILYLVEPSSYNVDVLNDWAVNEKRNEIYLPDKFNTKCYTYILKKSNTLFLPRNWIYAFFTYDNTLMFYGELITSTTSGSDTISKKRKIDKTD